MVRKKDKGLIEFLTENKKSFNVTQILKDELKNKNFSYPIIKARFQIRYVFEDKKCGALLETIFFQHKETRYP